MLRSLRKAFMTIAASLALAVIPAGVPLAVVSAQNVDIGNQLQCGSNLDTKGQNCTVNTGTDKINNLIRDVVNIFSAIVGIVAVVMVIWGGFKYITSGGDSNNVTAAKNTIIFAIVGLVIVAMAQFIVQFVLGKITGNG